MNEETALSTETGDSVSAESSALADQEENSETVSGSVEPEMVPVETEKFLTDWFTETTEATDPAETGSVLTVGDLLSSEETIAETTEPVYVEVIEQVGSDIVHADLFGDFLLCGTLVGIALFRKIYGT